MTLPRNEYGNVVTSAEFGHAWLVKVEYNTEADGRWVDPDFSPHPFTLHGPFVSEAEVQEWMDSYPEGTDIFDMSSIFVNNVRPSL